MPFLLHLLVLSAAFEGRDTWCPGSDDVCTHRRESHQLLNRLLAELKRSDDSLEVRLQVPATDSANDRRLPEGYGENGTVPALPGARWVMHG